MVHEADIAAEKKEAAECFRRGLQFDPPCRPTVLYWLRSLRGQNPRGPHLAATRTELVTISQMHEVMMAVGCELPDTGQCSPCSRLLSQ
jgi:hypothetical protein